MRVHCVIHLTLCVALLWVSACASQGPEPDPRSDASSQEVTWHPDVPLPEEFPLRVGQYWPAGSDFSELVDEQEMEIVQGFQGGVHTEIALELDFGLDYAEVQMIYVDLLAQTYLKGEGLVAELELSNFKAGNLGFGVFRSQTIPIVFDLNEAKHYVDRDAEIVVQVTLEAQQSARAIPVRLIDTGDETMGANTEI